MKKRISGSPEELRFKAARCAAKALGWLRRGAELERAARRQEKRRDSWEKQQWPESFCKTCVAGKSCQIHEKKS